MRDSIENLRFAGMLPMQSADILGQRTLPGDWHWSMLRTSAKVHLLVGEWQLELRAK